MCKILSREQHFIAMRGDTMRIDELTQKQCEVIADYRPSWMADHHPFWMADHRPLWMADHRPFWMATKNVVPEDILNLINEG